MRPTISSFVTGPPPRGSARARRRRAPARSARPRAPRPRAAARAARRRRRSAGSPPASAAGSPGGTSRPFSPSLTISGTPPTAVAITGVPTASASTTVCGKFSHADERIAASAVRKSASTSSRPSAPRNSTRSASPSAAARDSSAARSSPSPASRSVTPVAGRDRLERDAEVLLRRQPARERERRAGAPSSGQRAAADGRRVRQHRDAGRRHAPAGRRARARNALGQITCAARRSSTSRARRSRPAVEPDTLVLEVVERAASSGRAAARARRRGPGSA